MAFYEQIIQKHFFRKVDTSVRRAYLTPGVIVNKEDINLFNNSNPNVSTTPLAAINTGINIVNAYCGDSPLLSKCALYIIGGKTTSTILPVSSNSITKTTYLLGSADIPSGFFGDPLKYAAIVANNAKNNVLDRFGNQDTGGGPLTQNTKMYDYSNVDPKNDVVLRFMLNNRGSISEDSIKKIRGYIRTACEKYKMDDRLIAAQMLQESGYNERATSYVGAMGLMQLMPGTAAGLGVRNGYNGLECTLGGVKYLRQQYDSFKTVEKALAAYNAGPGNVEHYGGIPPFRETENYVRVIMGNYNKMIRDSGGK